MNTLTLIIAGLVSIPGSVWLLAEILGIIDNYRTPSGVIRAVVRSAVGVVIVLGVAVLVHRDFVMVFATSFAAIVVLHFSWFFVMRRWLTGVPQYRLEPPERPADLPEMDDE